MRIMHPRGSVRRITTGKPNGGFAIICDEVVYEFSDIKAMLGQPTLVKCSATSRVCPAPTEGTWAGQIEGRIHYNFNVSDRASVQKITFLDFRFPGEQPGAWDQVYWEIPEGVMRMVFDPDMMRAFMMLPSSSSDQQRR